MKREAVTIRKLGVRPDLVVSSPLLRALQTAEIVAKELDLLDKLLTDERLSPGFNVTLLNDLLRAHQDASSILLVGHEPDFSATAGKLIGNGSIVFKKGALALIELSDPATMRGELAWLIPPKMLSL